ncbi:MAG: HPr family phosphocarrier protein [Symbiobacterium sp.]|uniref:HPr family phosphocarrier protein n=1 Tax=Symbiobacterium sp. TaxID=1971213 RepID=UPI0034644E95
MSVERQAVIRSKSGLHARPAARVVKEANRFRSQVELVTQGKAVSLKSLISVLSLGLNQGAEVTVRASGPDEVEAAEGLAQLLETDLG